MTQFTEIQHPPKWLIIFIITINAIGLGINVALMPEKIWVGLFAIIMILFLGTLYFLFGRLKTDISSNGLKLQFGKGFIKKYIPINHISGCRVVKNSWTYGWGIRWIGFGHWMWNIKGLYAVELTFTNSKKKFRIGSQKSEELSNVITTMINN